MGAESGVLRARGGRARSRLLWQSVLTSVAVIAALLALFGAIFAGSPARIAAGVRIAGVNVGGMRPADARALLERRAAALENVPVTFFTGEQRWRITPRRLGVEADWRAAIGAAQREGEGLGPFRGLRRVKVRVFGADIAPPAKAYEPALEYQLGQLTAEIDRPHREAAVVLGGLKPILVDGQSGKRLDRDRAAATLVGALASLTRSPTPLPVRVQRPSVTAVDLRPALARARRAVSAPIRLELGKTWWRLRPVRIAELLSLPRDGSRTVEIGGPGAERWFARFGQRVGRPPVDATFRPAGDGTIALVPHRDGLALDVDAMRTSMLKAALAPRGRRVGSVVVATKHPQLTSTEARGLGVTNVLASYSTFYSGTADRISNLQLAVSLIDGTLVPPGGTFSLNHEVGPRTIERGFRPAPVIIDGEYEEGVGGGVSQVATTTFNAAWEAGLKIVERNPHSLYIGRYPLGRDATVNYPDLDLKFRNDTSRWLVVFGASGSDGIAITIGGTPTRRRVVSSAGPLTVTGPIPVKRVPDPNLSMGTKVVDEEGSPPQSVTVTRVVYDRDGSVLYNETWRTNYRGEKRVIRFGTKKEEPKPSASEDEPKRPPAKGEEPEPAPAPAPPPPGGEPVIP